MEQKYKDFYYKVGLNIMVYRRQMGLTQLQLAELAGISRTFMSHIESSKHPVGMSMKTLYDIANALCIEPYKLLQFLELDT